MFILVVLAIDEPGLKLSTGAAQPGFGYATLSSWLPTYVQRTAV
jgi:hypothetical protein